MILALLIILLIVEAADKNMISTTYLYVVP